jgi:hypothetical protein
VIKALFAKSHMSIAAISTFKWLLQRKPRGGNLQMWGAVEQDTEMAELPGRADVDDPNSADPEPDGACDMERTQGRSRTSPVDVDRTAKTFTARGMDPFRNSEPSRHRSGDGWILIRWATSAQGSYSGFPEGRGRDVKDPGTGVPLSAPLPCLWQRVQRLLMNEAYSDRSVG